MSRGGDPKELAKEAELLLSVGRVAEAERVCHALLLAAPDHPTALMILGAVCMAAGRLAEAEVFLRRGCEVHPQIVGFHAALGRTRLQLGQPSEALEPLENCVLLDPNTGDHRAGLVVIYQTISFVTFNERSKQAMLACLADETLTHSLMHEAWLSLLRVDPKSADFLELFDAAVDYPSFCARLVEAPWLLRAIQTAQLLWGGLGRFPAADVAIDRGLTYVRRWFFEYRSAVDWSLAILCSLARYCFLTGYVFKSDEDYRPLRADASTAAAVALLGCYEPLWPDERAAQWSHLTQDACYRDLVQALIEEPLEEQSLRSSISSTSPIDDNKNV